MIEYKPVLFIVGILLSVLAVVMLIPAVVDIFAQDNDWVGFFISAFLSAFVGISLILTNKGGRFGLNLKQAFILTTLSWVAVVAFGALPFLFSELKLSYTDAFFETMSGITTTGATVLVGLDYLPPGILLWRSLLAGIGAIGIIVFATAILPMLRIGGMQLFKAESSDKSDKIVLRMKQISLFITSVYMLLVVACAASLWLAGMSGFDAINHSLAAVATAGFSTHDSGFAFYNNSSLEYITAVFMMAGGLPFVLYVQFLRGDGKSVFKNQQVRWYLRILIGSIAMVAFWLHCNKNMYWYEAFRYAVFNVTSVMTTTGFGGTDYSQWGSFVVMFLFALSIVGGCAGSAAGGIKIFRLQMLYQIAKVQLVQLIQPHAVVRMRYNGKAVLEGVVLSVMSFVVLYGLFFMLISLVLSFTGLDFLASMSAAAACLSNSAHGLGDTVGSMGNYSIVTDLGKWTLAFAMLLGRLEIFTILVLFSVKFWKD